MARLESKVKDENPYRRYFIAFVNEPNPLQSVATDLAPETCRSHYPLYLIGRVKEAWILREIGWMRELLGRTIQGRVWPTHPPRGYIRL